MARVEQIEKVFLGFNRVVKKRKKVLKELVERFLKKEKSDSPYCNVRTKTELRCTASSNQQAAVSNS